MHLTEDRVEEWLRLENVQVATTNELRSFLFSEFESTARPALTALEQGLLFDTDIDDDLSDISGECNVDFLYST